MGFYRGYILTRENFETGGNHRLRYTGICDHGPFEIIIAKNRPLILGGVVWEKNFVPVKRVEKK